MERTCKEKIPEKYAGRRDDIDLIWRAYTKSLTVKDIAPVYWKEPPEDRHIDTLENLATEQGFEDGQAVEHTENIHVLMSAFLETIKDKLAFANNPKKLRNLAIEYYAESFIDGFENNNNCESEFHEYGEALTFEEATNNTPSFFCWLFGFGGPHDELRFFCGPDYSLTGVEYLYAWGDNATLKIDRNHEDWDLWSEIWEHFKDCETPQSLFKKWQKENRPF
jgi:hypothetical protein